MKKSSKLNYKNFTLFLGYIGLLIGIVLGVIYSFGGLLIDSLKSLNLITTSATPGLSIGTLYGFGALLGIPLIGGVIGLITGVIGGFMYNTFTSFIPLKDFDIYK